jgi:hypothetical protein
MTAVIRSRKLHHNCPELTQFLRLTEVLFTRLLGIVCMVYCVLSCCWVGLGWVIFYGVVM